VLLVNVAQVWADTSSILELTISNNTARRRGNVAEFRMFRRERHPEMSLVELKKKQEARQGFESQERSLGVNE